MILNLPKTLCKMIVKRNNILMRFDDGEIVKFEIRECVEVEPNMEDKVNIGAITLKEYNDWKNRTLALVGSPGSICEERKAERGQQYEDN